MNEVDKSLTTQIGVPHQCEETSEFKGVTIEKGTIVMACEWYAFLMAVSLTESDC
jgi:hypothetical protein